MAEVTEIAPDIFRLSAYHAGPNFQFNSFLIRDDEPMLMHTNLRGFFDEIHEAASTVIDVSKLRWIGFSHFESDECGSLNDWLAAAPHAEPVCSFVGARTSIGDFSDREPKVLEPGERIETGRRSVRVIETKHVPHGWDACMMHEETEGTLFCSDLFGHNGEVEPVTEGDIVGRSAAYSSAQQEGPMAGSVPFTHQTRKILNDLADLRPKTLACMHGSSFSGDGAAALRDLADVWESSFGGAGT